MNYGLGGGAPVRDPIPSRIRESKLNFETGVKKYLVGGHFFFSLVREGC